MIGDLNTNLPVHLACSFAHLQDPPPSPQRTRHGGGFAFFSLFLDCGILWGGMRLNIIFNGLVAVFAVVFDILQFTSIVGHCHLSWVFGQSSAAWGPLLFLVSFSPGVVRCWLFRTLIPPLFSDGDWWMC